DRQPEVRYQAPAALGVYAKSQAAPGEHAQALARRRMLVEHMVERRDEGRQRQPGKLSHRRRRGVAHWACWMPARIQPPEPLTGLARFQISSNASAAWPGCSRSMPV